VTTIADLLSFPLSIFDPGSDDITLTTNFGDSNIQEDTFLNNPSIGPDPFPSPEINPRTLSLTGGHQYGLPGVYGLTLSALDDDGGAGGDQSLVIATDNQTEIRTVGFWKNQYGQKVGTGVIYNSDFLFGFWEIIKFVSRIYDEAVSAQTLPEIEAILSKSEIGNPMVERARSQCLATLFNFASGSIDWDQLVDTDGETSDPDRIPDTVFSEAITQAEELILSPTSTDSEYEQAKDICDSINSMDSTGSP